MDAADTILGLSATGVEIMLVLFAIGRRVASVLVGILSDSHGHCSRVRRAAALFEKLGVEHVIHCGDVGGEGVFSELLGKPLTFVWGNTDLMDRRLFAYLEGVGLAIPESIPARVELDGKHFAVFHGHEGGFHHALGHLDVDYLCHGHTHMARDDRAHGKRIINPGALTRATPTTVATLDTSTDELTFHRIRD